MIRHIMEVSVDSFTVGSACPEFFCFCAMFFGCSDFVCRFDLQAYEFLVSDPLFRS